uniref:Putative DNA binding, helix-turn-helix domain containing protein n=1 Tax=viral metagenome TaxID=1070528 RepID=A0A6M3LP70_9ZZZZ
MLSSVGEKIEILQCENGLSLNALSQMTGISRQRLYQIKRAKKLNPVTINKLSKGLGIPISYIREYCD